MSPPRVVRNDWSGLAVPELGRWRPTRSVSVVIPAYRCQASLDLVLAALAHQTYPASLLEVVVVDDGSQPPLVLPELRPDHCRLLRPPDGWGRANALAYGARHSEGEILHWLDADMVAYPEHVEAQARWHHLLPYAVTLGYKRFVDVRPGAPHWPSVRAVARACADRDAGALFAGLPSEPHSYVEDAIRRTGQLRGADHTAFLVHVGATAALSRELYDLAGGLDPRLRLGEDTELGYRLAQAGAVFIPEPAARAWHLGRTHMMRHEQQLRRYNRPHLADRMPQPQWLRRAGGSGWSVPLVTVVVEVGGQPLEPVRATVDSVLASDQRDLRVLLVGPWAELTDQRVFPLADPWLELRLIAATYRSDPRVELVERPPETGFPSPFVLRLPSTRGLARPALRRLVEYADRERLGLVRAGPDVELWRTAAVHRARWVRRGGESLAEVVAEVYGAGTVDPAVVGVVDLSGYHPDQLAEGVMLPAGQWLPASVPVAGFRSLARATWLVTRLAADRLRRRLPGRRQDVR